MATRTREDARPQPGRLRAWLLEHAAVEPELARVPGRRPADHQHSWWKVMCLTDVYALITVVFAYTTVVNVIERPDGVRIASFFVVAIVVISLVSRVLRATELRATHVELDATAARLVDMAAAGGELAIIANEPNARDALEYVEKERDERTASHIPDDEPILFLEVTVPDASEFEDVLRVTGEERFGHHVLTVESSAVPNAIAAVLLHLRDRTGKRPPVYFGWTEGNPVLNLLRYLISGEGEIAPTTREVLRKAERDPARRPLVHVG